MNCKLTKNISIATNAGGGCNGQDMSMAGGIKTPVYIYNIDDVTNLKFENDSRADGSLTVDTIVTDAAFYAIEFTNATYNESFEDNKWTHTLTLTIGNITNTFQSSLFDATGGRYLVAFRPSGDQDYRLFGWKYGASLSYTMDIAEDTQGYTVTLEDTSEYPLMACYRDNFDVRNKVYTPIFEPYYEASYCEQSGGANDGYSIAMYVLKVNSAGQALDENNKLCQWSGKKQDAYKFSGVTSDSNYHILGTYGPSAEFDGKPVRIYDPEVCPSTALGSITINGYSALTMNLNSVTTSSSVTISSDASWVLLTAPNYVTVSPNNGGMGTTSVTVIQNGTGGVDNLVFQNRRTRERVTLTVNVNIIRVNPLMTYQNNATSAVISPVVQGVTTAFTYTVSPSTTNYMTDGNVVLTFGHSESERNFVVTLTHLGDPNETKQVTVRIMGENSDPSWWLFNYFCEIE